MTSFPNRFSENWHCSKFHRQRDACLKKNLNQLVHLSSGDASRLSPHTYHALRKNNNGEVLIPLNTFLWGGGNEDPCSNKKAMQFPHWTHNKKSGLMPPLLYELPVCSTDDYWVNCFTAFCCIVHFVVVNYLMYPIAITWFWIYLTKDSVPWDYLPLKSSEIY